MDNLGPAGEFLRISEHYHRLTEDELLILARRKEDLTPMAQEALSNELAHRRLKLEPEEAPTRPKPEPPKPKPAPPVITGTAGELADSEELRDPYEEDRALVDICTVWSVADALQVQGLLDTAGIPFFMGAEQATDVKAVTSDFAKGVAVQIMRVGVPWARQAMQHYVPRNDQSPKEPEEVVEVAVRCPKCHSTEVVLEEMIPSTAEGPVPERFEWTCDSCGNRWEDDGVLKEE
jgi:DNA-directed RNA polymerase subunit M/transcription elongation factor TFIIS